MNVKIKTSILLISTLLIGIIIGGFTGSYLSRKMIHDRISRLRTQEGFIHRFDRSIQPTAEQEKIVHRLLTVHYLKMDSMSTDFRLKMKNMNDSLLIDMNSLLDQEQLDRLKKRLQRMQRFTGSRESDKK